MSDCLYLKYDDFDCLEFIYGVFKIGIYIK